MDRKSEITPVVVAGTLNQRVGGKTQAEMDEARANYWATVESVRRPRQPRVGQILISSRGIDPRDIVFGTCSMRYMPQDS